MYLGNNTDFSNLYNKSSNLLARVATEPLDLTYDREILYS